MSEVGFFLGHVLEFLLFFAGRCFLGDIALFAVPSDLTAEERQELENIRRRKQELLADIQVGGCWEAGRCGSTWFVAVCVKRCPQWLLLATALTKT